MLALINDFFDNSVSVLRPASFVKGPSSRYVDDSTGHLEIDRDETCDGDFSFSLSVVIYILISKPVYYDALDLPPKRRLHHDRLGPRHPRPDVTRVRPCSPLLIHLNLTLQLLTANREREEAYYNRWFILPPLMPNMCPEELLRYVHPFPTCMIFERREKR